MAVNVTDCETPWSLHVFRIPEGCDIGGQSLRMGWSCSR
jgi:hypothetical protein